ncbi:hypothetical protein EVAR_9679_1 [Eumeta japonica]|uniref:Uncharacterized protein n=1 Tax=Eumeta variegata TaxID=151549 RepID=A0A4C1YDW5_EUMVA|nr:hypothetical protein EVAR_9679_1 [Eumeta japonica]
MPSVCVHLYCPVFEDALKLLSVSLDRKMSGDTDKAKISDNQDEDKKSGAGDGQTSEDESSQDSKGESKEALPTAPSEGNVAAAVVTGSPEGLDESTAPQDITMPIGADGESRRLVWTGSRTPLSSRSVEKCAVFLIRLYVHGCRVPMPGWPIKNRPIGNHKGDVSYPACTLYTWQEME